MIFEAFPSNPIKLNVLNSTSKYHLPSSTDKIPFSTNAPEAIESLAILLAFFNFTGTEYGPSGKTSLALIFFN